MINVLKMTKKPVLKYCANGSGSDIPRKFNEKLSGLMNGGKSKD